MKKQWIFLVVTVACLYVTSCSQRNEALEKRIAQLESKLDSIAAQRQASVTEVFHLRSECADLGVKILRNNPAEIGLTASQVSHYNPKTNRCYVELTMHPTNPTAAPYVLERFLFEGQTGELLAHATINGKKLSGIVFKRNIFDWQGSNSYIDEIMRDE